MLVRKRRHLKQRKASQNELKNKKLPKPEKSSAVQTWSCHEGMLLYMFAVFLVEKRSRTQNAESRPNSMPNKIGKTKERKNKTNRMKPAETPKS